MYFGFSAQSGLKLMTLTQFLADRCNATFGYCHEMSSVVCLSSVTRVYCGQSVGRIKMKLGVQVGLGPGHIVLDGDLAPLPQRGTASPIFGPYLLRPNGCMDQDATWYGARSQPRRLCVRWGPALPSPKRGRSPPNFRPMFIVAKQLDGSRWYLAWR